MNRVADWEKKLTDVLDDYKSEPWTWGRSDCAHFAGDCVRAITGRDPLGAFRGNYTSRLEAWARLRYWKHKTFEATVAAVMADLGCPEGVPECSMVGDVGFTDMGVLCVRFPVGFIARGEDAQFHKVRAVRSWCVAWPGVE